VIFISTFGESSIAVYKYLSGYCLAAEHPIHGGRSPPYDMILRQFCLYLILRTSFLSLVRYSKGFQILAENNIFIQVLILTSYFLYVNIFVIRHCYFACNWSCPRTLSNSYHPLVTWRNNGRGIISPFCIASVNRILLNHGFRITQI